MLSAHLNHAERYEEAIENSQDALDIDEHRAGTAHAERAGPRKPLAAAASAAA